MNEWISTWAWTEVRAQLLGVCSPLLLWTRTRGGAGLASNERQGLICLYLFSAEIRRGCCHIQIFMGMLVLELGSLLLFASHWVFSLCSESLLSTEEIDRKGRGFIKITQLELEPKSPLVKSKHQATSSTSGSCGCPRWRQCLGNQAAPDITNS